MTEHGTPLCYSLSHYNAQCGSNICINADRLPIYLLRTNCLPLIDTGISGMGVLRRHLPEGVLDDDRRIVAYTQFQEENALPTLNCTPFIRQNFFGLLKSELLYLQEFRSMEHFKQELMEYLDYYNNRRIKAKLKGLPPAIHRQQALSVA